MKIQRWSLGLNSYPQWIKGDLYVEHVPLRVAMVDWFCIAVVLRIASPLYRIPIWKGLSVGCLLYLHVHVPLFQWAWKHPGRVGYTVELGYVRASEIFGDGMADHFDYEAELHAPEPQPEEQE